MRKTREINFYKVIMIAIIISFSFLFAGVIGLNVEVKDVNNNFITMSVGEGDGESKITYVNWVESEKNVNGLDVQTDVTPSESIDFIDGVWQINSLEDWLYAMTMKTPYAGYSLNCDIILNDGYFDDDGIYHDGGDGKCYMSVPLSVGTTMTFRGNGYKIKGFYIDDRQMTEEIFAETNGRPLAMFRGCDSIKLIDNLYIEDIYLHAVGKKTDNYYNQCSIFCNTGITKGENLHVLSGSLKANMNVHGFTNWTDELRNCTTAVNIFAGQDEILANLSSQATVAFVMRMGSGKPGVVDCINYGNVESKSRHTCGIALTGTITNCKNYGEIKNYGQLGAEGIGGNVTIKNCVNYGEIISTYSPCGISREGSKINCINYGNVIVEGTNSVHFASGIGGGVTNGVIENCVNYGNISAPNGGSAVGVVHVAYGNEKYQRVINCKNYGKISGAYSSGIANWAQSLIVGCINYGEINATAYGGGILASQFEKDILIKDCKNYGKIVGLTTSAYLGGLVGRFWGYNYPNSFKPTVHIQNCVVECDFLGQSSYAGNFVGFQEESKATTFENCKVTTHEYLDTDFGFIFGRLGNKSGNTIRVNDFNLIKNCDIKTTAHGNGNTYIVIENLLGKLTLDGVVVKEKNGSVSSLLIKSSTGEETYKSLIIDRKNYKNAFGENFDAFYYKWKTGEIGVKTIDGNGFFQGEVDRQYLFDNKYITSLEEQEEFTELEYIESTGKEYIDTGVIAKPTVGFYVDFQLCVTGKEQDIIANLSPNLAVYAVNGEFKFAHKDGYGTTASFGVVEDLLKHEIYLNYLNDRKAICDEKESEISTQMTQTGKNIYIFAGNLNNTVYAPASCRIYSAKITEGSTLVRDFVPVIRNADQAVGLYDKVEGKFYENKGSGNFLPGNIVK